MPAALMYNLGSDKYNWYYHTEPQVIYNVEYEIYGRVISSEVPKKMFHESIFQNLIILNGSEIS